MHYLIVSHVIWSYRAKGHMSHYVWWDMNCTLISSFWNGNNRCLQACAIRKSRQIAIVVIFGTYFVSRSIGVFWTSSLTSFEAYMKEQINLLLVTSCVIVTSLLLLYFFSVSFYINFSKIGRNFHSCVLLCHCLTLN